MEVAKSSLINMLLEEGEENIAVLLARSTLPEVLDTERDAAELTEIGLGADEVRAMTTGLHGGGRRAEGGQMDRTISRRWADLVDKWNRR